MKLVQFEKEDLETYMRLATEFHSGPATFTPPNEAVFKRNFEHIIEQETAYGFFIYHDDHLAGYALCSEMFSTEVGGMSLWLEEISVHEDFQGQGLGSQTIGMIIDAFPNIKRFRLEVAPSNDMAIKLYEKLGYHFLKYEQMVYDRK